MDSVLGLVRHAGNEGLFRAIELSLLAAVAGHPLHLHAEGLRGTGKTTVLRAARRLLPQISRIKGCLYNCDPAAPHCPQHRTLSPDEVGTLGDEMIPMPFLEISHSAKVGTVVGSIDLGRLVNPTRPEAALLPGTLPQAHRGIIFVDEINRLAETAPELADILLDAMGTKPGRIQIEETGLPPVELPVQVTVWAASNPDEDPGPLEEVRRQLSDRFDFAVYADRPSEALAVEQILSCGQDGVWNQSLSTETEREAEAFRLRLIEHASSLRRVSVPPEVRQQIADLYSRFGVESLRAVQAIQLGLCLAAALAQRTEAQTDDLAHIAPLALRHRIDPDGIKKVMVHLASLRAYPDPLTATNLPAVKRFPSINFGGAAAADSSAAGTVADSAANGAGKAANDAGTAVQMPEGARRQGDGSAKSGQRSWATQYIPRPQPPSELAGKERWWRRAVDRVRRGVGSPSADPQRRGAAAQATSADSTSAAPVMLDPLTTALLAPSGRARPIGRIDPTEIVRAEEELFRS